MKIVSLIPSATEIISALNLYDNLVGVSHECDYPKKALKLPKLTTSKIKTEQVSLKIDYDIRKILNTKLKHDCTCTHACFQNASIDISPINYIKQFIFLILKIINHRKSP